MKSLITLALAAAFAAPAAAQTSIPIAVNCGSAASAGEAPDLHGNWDILMDVGGEPSFGLMSIGRIDGGWGGSVTPSRTAPVVLRRITLTGNAIHMVVASSDGDVLFDGTLSAKGDRMCGTITYHGGRTFPMVAHKRPSAYRPQPRAAR